MIRVAIANDTLIALTALRRVIATNPAYELVWSATDGAEAVALCKRDTPDLILMDLQMPGLDGVEATRQIMAHSPCAILIVTGSVHRHTSQIFEAMGHGALDVVRTPVLGLQEGGSMDAAARPLLAKMATVTAFIGKSIRRKARVPLPSKSSPQSDSLPPLIAIGASTGGPKAIAQIVSGFPEPFPAAVVIVQHIDQQFAPGLANWLNGQTVLDVRLAEVGDRLLPGRVYVAGSDRHLVMAGDLTLAYTHIHRRTAYCPSVDEFFNSVARHWPEKGQAALLTGMGSDGANGLGALRAAGWETIAESQESCVVYGMPRAAVENKAASRILPAKEISDAFCRKLLLFG
ncbi:MAG: chemotaxis response regulator protein-glutamate methylesterase [Cyanobacteria bacterium J06560_2]